MINRFQILFDIFKENNEQLFFVGGAVRDHLLEIEPNDVDFATSALPEKTIEILKTNNLKAIPIGIKFGTVQTFVGKEKVEITTFRSKESYRKGSRKPTVVFGKTIEEDLARRDFTINAMAISKWGNLYDPFKGQIDLYGKSIRTPIDPKVSFSDDPLRLLRACRFAARFNFFIERETFWAMKELAHKVKEVSSERVFEEMTKILLLPKGTIGLTEMVDTGIMSHLFPEIQRMVDFKQNQGKWHSKTVWPHTLEVIKNAPPRPAVKWASLVHDIAKPLTHTEDETGVHFHTHEWRGALIWEEIAKRLRVSNAFRDHVSLLVHNHLRISALAEEGASKRALRRLARDAEDKLDDLFDLSLADITSHKPSRVEAKRNKALEIKKKLDDLIVQDNIPTLKFPKGSSLIVAKALGIEVGPELGKVMKKLNQLLIDGDIQPDDNLVEVARRFFVDK